MLIENNIMHQKSTENISIKGENNKNLYNKWNQKTIW